MAAPAAKSLTRRVRDRILSYLTYPYNILHAWFLAPLPRSPPTGRFRSHHETRLSRILDKGLSPFRWVRERYEAKRKETMHLSTRCRVHRRWTRNVADGKAKRVWKWVRAGWWLTWAWDWGFCWWERRRDAVPPGITTRPSGKMLEGEGEGDEKGLMRWMWIGRGKGGAKGRGKSRNCGQKGSLFFKLPTELRNKIYQHLFKEERVYVVLVEGRLACYEAVVDEDGKVHVGERTGLGVMPFIGCCRRVYTETIPLLYSSPTLIFTHPSTFLTFSYLIPAPRFHAIHTLVLDFAEHVPKRLKPPYMSLLWGRIQSKKKVEFHVLHVCQHRAFFNEALGDLGMGRKVKGEETVWIWICAILGQMEGLIDLRVSVRESRADRVLEPLEGLLSKKREDGGVGMRRLVVETLTVLTSGFTYQRWWEGGFDGEEGDGAVKGEGRWRRVKKETEYLEGLILLGAEG